MGAVPVRVRLGEGPRVGDHRLELGLPRRPTELVADPLAGRHEPGRIATAYLELADDEPQRFRVIDAALPPEQVVDQALAALADLLPR